MTIRDRHDFQLETDRLVLRQPEAADAKPIAKLLGGFDVSKNLGRVPYPYDVKDAEEFLSRVNKAWGMDMYTFAICLKSQNNCCIGVGGPFNFLSHTVELGYWLGKDYWGRGLMSEAALALVDLVFERMKAPYLVANHMIDNPGSGRVLEKCGFRQTDKRALYSFARGEFAPARVLRLDQTDWQTQQIRDQS